MRNYWKENRIEIHWWSIIWIINLIYWFEKFFNFCKLDSRNEFNWSVLYHRSIQQTEQSVLLVRFCRSSWRFFFQWSVNEIVPKRNTITFGMIFSEQFDLTVLKGPESGTAEVWSDLFSFSVRYHFDWIRRKSFENSGVNDVNYVVFLMDQFSNPLFGMSIPVKINDFSGLMQLDIYSKCNPLLPIPSHHLSSLVKLESLQITSNSSTMINRSLHYFRYQLVSIHRMVQVMNNRSHSLENFWNSPNNSDRLQLIFHWKFIKSSVWMKHFVTPMFFLLYLHPFKLIYIKYVQSNMTLMH